MMQISFCANNFDDLEDGDISIDQDEADNNDDAEQSGYIYIPNVF
jgi:hypothetical protein